MLSIYVEDFELFLIPTQCSSETWLLASFFFTPKAEVWEALATEEPEVLPWKLFSPWARREDPVGSPSHLQRFQPVSSFPEIWAEI